jgi:hypothetical protein
VKCRGKGGEIAGGYSLKAAANNGQVCVGGRARHGHGRPLECAVLVLKG